MRRSTQLLTNRTRLMHWKGEMTAEPHPETSLSRVPVYSPDWQDPPFGKFVGIMAPPNAAN